MSNFDVIIIGAGVSGCFCAISKIKKIKLLLIDANDDILKKFMITGKGKSNIANTSSPDEFIKNIIDMNKFLYPGINKHNGNDILKLLDEAGISYYEKQPHRFHLKDDNTKFVQYIWTQLKKQNVEVLLNTKVINVSYKKNEFFVKTKKQIFSTQHLVMATGGLSYQNFNCKGFGYEVAKKFKHSISPVYPIGVGLYIEDHKFKELQGISLDDVEIKVFWDQKLIYKECGPFMFTHYGFGGPVTRRVSGYVSKWLQNHESCDINISFINKQVIDEEFNSNHYLNECFKNFNKNVIKTLLNNFNLSIDLKNTKKSTIQQIINAINNVKFSIHKTESIDYAINTGGGVSLKQIDPNTYESRLVKNLYFIGEVLDINPRTNGYNITTCYISANMCINAINQKYK